MRQNLLALFTLLFLIGLVVPRPVTGESEAAFDVATTPNRAESPVAGTRHQSAQPTSPTLAKTKRTTNRRSSTPVLKLDPEPGGLHKGPRTQERGLSIRGLRLNKNRDAIPAGYEIRPTGLEPLVGSERYGRVGVSWLKFDDYQGMVDQHGNFGYITGNGVERFGTPILRTGNSGRDVERVLGQPDSARLPYCARENSADWTYKFENFDLTIQFRRGVVDCFWLIDYDMLHSGC